MKSERNNFSLRSKAENRNMTSLSNYEGLFIGIHLLNTSPNNILKFRTNPTSGILPLQEFEADRSRFLAYLGLRYSFIIKLVIIIFKER